jgi:MFS family permease
MKIDLVGPTRRGLAMGLNEAAGYGAVALTAFATGLLAEEFGLRPAPFLLGLAFAALGLGASVLFVGETRPFADFEADSRPATSRSPMGQVMLTTTLRERALSAASQAGFVNNLNDGMAWGLLPLYFAAAGLPIGQIGILAALYPAVWGLGQPLTGALSDRLGRKRLIAGGLFLQAGAIALMAVGGEFVVWASAAVLLGAGTAMVYPTLLAAIGDVAHPSWRASAVGVYRFWRDLGFAGGALLGGVVADLAGFDAAIWTIAGVTALSGVIVVVRMYETHPRALTEVAESV